MSSLRVVIFRSSMALNACLILYLCLSWSSSPAMLSSRVDYQESSALYNANLSRKLYKDNEPPEGIQKLNNNSIDTLSKTLPGKMPSDVDQTIPLSPNSKKLLIIPEQPSQTSLNNEVGEDAIKSTAERHRISEDQQNFIKIDEVYFKEPPREVQEAAGIIEPQTVLSPIVEEAPNPPLNSQERKMYPDWHECTNHATRSLYTQSGEYWILNNYIPSAMGFRCDESVTYSTHGDFTFLDNLDPLTSRWQGPVSVSVYAPGTDFQHTIDTIMYLRNCLAEGIKKYVTFHIFFHSKYMPKKIPTTDELLQLQTSCARDPPKLTNVTTFRNKNRLLYPVNIARNTARLNAQTFFVLVSDIELYPSVNFIPEFLNMLKKPDVSTTMNPRVYVFPIFEVEESIAPPETKAELVNLLKNQKAIMFHHRVCARCHSQPNSTEWQKAPIQAGLSVFVVSNRLPPFDKWEPIFVGTNKEPIYDERLSWEGKSDKMSQMNILCTRNYEFHILDNAFLVHRPGIKLLKETMSVERDKIVKNQNNFISKKIRPEYRTLYGYKKGCNF